MRVLMSLYFQNKEQVVVGVILDTHGILVPAAIKALHGVDLIIHAAQPRQNSSATLALLHIRGNSIKTQIVDIVD
jgi:hypothetical protein